MAPNVLNCMSCALSPSLPLLYVLPSSKEQSGEKTNNGTHYKLQLLYSNGELISVSVESSFVLTHLGPHIGATLIFLFVKNTLMIVLNNPQL